MTSLRSEASHFSEAMRNSSKHDNYALLNSKSLIKNEKAVIKHKIYEHFKERNLGNKVRSFSLIENYVSRNIIGDQITFR